MPDIAPARRWELCIAIIIKNERAYLEEWIAYHHAIGVQHFFVFDHGSTDGTRESIEHWVNRGLVTVIDWPRVHGQLDAYAFAVRIASGLTDWLAIIDMDEFICSTGETSLRDYLRALDADQLLIRWRWFGHSGHRSRPPGLVIENFDRVRPDLSDTVKSVFRPEAVLRAGVHVQTTREGRTVDLRGERVAESWRLAVPAGAGVVEPFQVNHYYCRSYEEYLHKMTRGDANVNKVQLARPFEFFDFPGEDRRLVVFAPVVRERIAAMHRKPADPLPSGSLGGGVAPATTIALHHLVRDALLDWAEALGEGVKASFVKSNAGIRLRFDVTEGGMSEATLIEHLRGYLGEIGKLWGGEWAAHPVSEAGSASPVKARTRKGIRSALFEGHSILVLLVQATAPTKVGTRLDGQLEGRGTMDRASIGFRGAGLWVALQLLGDRPVVPQAVKLSWQPEEGDVLDGKLWFVN